MNTCQPCTTTRPSSANEATPTAISETRSSARCNGATGTATVSGSVIGTPLCEIADAAVQGFDLRLLAVFGQQRRSGSAECRHVDLVELHAVVDHLLARHRLGGVPQVAHHRHRGARQFHHQAAVGRAQRLKTLARHHQDVRRVGMLALRPVMRGFEMPAGLKAAHVVFRTVDHVRFHRRKRFAQRHRRGVGAQHAHQLEEDVRRSHPQFQALEIFRAVQRMLGVVEAARARIVDGKTDQIALLEAAQHAVADMPVDGATQMRYRVEHIRQAQRLSEREGVVQRAGIHTGDVDGAEARHVDRLRFAAQLAGVVLAQLEPAVGAFFQLLAEPAHRFHGGVIADVHIGGSEQLPAGNRRGGAGTQPGGGSSGAEPGTEKMSACDHWRPPKRLVTGTAVNWRTQPYRKYRRCRRSESGHAAPLRCRGYRWHCRWQSDHRA
ncbi:hypothetical protein XAC2852_110010 [Xanthomonas citri pv. citri]|nr:hypothetical protein XAC2852_110010 [Xanthomonas citri pv. citri]